MGNCKRRQFSSSNSTNILRARPLIETNFKIKRDTKKNFTRNLVREGGHIFKIIPSLKTY